ncbi:MAG: permease [Actinomycetota bacterium]
MDISPAPLEQGGFGPPLRSEATWRTAASVAAMVVVGAVALRVLAPQNIGWAQNFLLVFSSLLIEAVPFVLIGALASAVIEVFVPSSAFEKLARLPKPLQLPAAGVAGIAFPVCECGSVPVARRLAAKGLMPSAAVTFMLAAPVVNPVVIASTLVAYNGRSNMWVMVIGRFTLGLIVAIAVGWVVGNRSKEELLKPRPEDQVAMEHEDEPKWQRFFSHMGGDFLFMGRFLLFGATISAAVQTFVPQSIVNGVANTPIFSLLAMMGLAFFLSLCSESDAFVAASFVQFGTASQLAFLVFGPMMDMKLGALYVGTYNRGFFRMVLITVTAVTLVGTLWIQVIWG